MRTLLSVLAGVLLLLPTAGLAVEAADLAQRLKARELSLPVTPAQCKKVGGHTSYQQCNYLVKACHARFGINVKWYGPTQGCRCDPYCDVDISQCPSNCAKKNGHCLLPEGVQPCSACAATNHCNLNYTTWLGSNSASPLSACENYCNSAVDDINGNDDGCILYPTTVTGQTCSNSICCGGTDTGDY